MTTPTLDLFAALQAVLEPQYRLERELGRGGMGVVFLATDTTLDRPVAIKVGAPRARRARSIGRRFLAEARTIARLRHPNIVAVHAAGNADGLLYYVMDRGRRREPARAARPGAAARSGARWPGSWPTSPRRSTPPAGPAWSTATSSRRTSCSTQATGRAMLADFGIARAMAGESATSSTGQGVAVGTPAYMSPEQAAGEEIDGRSDLYALGVVAYEMLAGAPPFRGPNRVVVSKHIAERPVPIERVRPDTPRPLAAAIMRALEKQPGRPLADRRGVPAGARGRATGGAPGPPAASPPGRRRAGRRAGGRRVRPRAAPARPAERGQSAPLDPGAAVRQPPRRPLGRLAPRGERQHARAQPVAVERPHGRRPRAAARSAGRAPAPPGRRRRARHGPPPRAGGRRLDRGARRLHPGRRLAPSRGAGVRRRQRQPGGRRPGGRPARQRRPAALRRAGRQAARSLGRAERGADRTGPDHHRIARGVSAPISAASSSSTGGTWRAPSASSSGRSASTPPSASPTTSSRSPAAGWWAQTTRSPTRPSSGPRPTPATSRRTTAPSSTPIAPSSAASTPTRGPPTSSCSPGISPTPTPGTASARRGSTIPPA